jgi:hypothetical protein
MASKQGLEGHRLETAGGSLPVGQEPELGEGEDGNLARGEPRSLGIVQEALTSFVDWDVKVWAASAVRTSPYVMRVSARDVAQPVDYAFDNPAAGTLGLDAITRIKSLCPRCSTYRQLERLIEFG